MKLSVYLVALSFAVTLGTAFASDKSDYDNDISSYCTEQAELAGIEDMVEKYQYVNDCVESFGANADTQQPGDKADQ